MSILTTPDSFSANIGKITVFTATRVRLSAALIAGNVALLAAPVKYYTLILSFRAVIL